MRSRVPLIILALAAAGALLLALRWRSIEAQTDGAAKQKVQASALAPANAPSMTPRSGSSGAVTAVDSAAPASGAAPATLAAESAAAMPHAGAVPANETSAPAAAATVTSSKGPPPVVGIQDGRTIDFSSGQPMIIDADKENAALAKALKEMEEATKDIVIRPAR